jgi:virulence-associated protein VapD
MIPQDDSAEGSGFGSEAEDVWTPPTWSNGRMYAIAFDLDTTALKKRYPTPQWRNAYGDIQRIMQEHKFWGQQGSLYYSNHGGAVSVMLAVTALKDRLPWFRFVVRDFRMLRIEENNDLLPLLGQPDLPLMQPVAPKRPSNQRIN